MGLPAEHPSAENLLARAFGVRDPVVLELLSELASGTAAASRADLIARRLGLSNRFALAWLLKRHNLPSLTELRACAHVLGWIRLWESNGVPLARQALGQGQDPAVWYRTVRRVTGHSWSEVRGTGTQALLDDLGQRYRGGSET